MTVNDQRSARELGSRRDVNAGVPGAAVASAHLLAAGVLGWTYLGFDNAPSFVVLSGMVLAICGGALLVQAKNGKMDLLNPVVIFSLVWSVMFGARPLMMHSAGDYTLRGRYSSYEYMDDALVLAVLSSVAFLAGYYILSVRLRCRKNTSLVRQSVDSGSNRFHPEIRRTAALLLLCLGGGASVLAYQPVLGGSSAYLYYLPLVLVPVAVGCFSEWLRTRSALTISVAVIAGCIFLARYTLTGQRAFVLFLLVGLVIVYYQHVGKSPKLRVAVTALAVVVGVIFYGFEVYRAQVRGGEVEKSASVSEALERVFMGGTTEMLPAFTVLLDTEGELWSQSRGRTAFTTAVHWIPSGLWPEKPRTYDEEMYSTLFPEHYAHDKANTQFSIMGDWYTDSGRGGVVVGMFLMGTAARWVHRRSEYRAGRWGIIYALFPVLFVTTLRGNIALNFGLALFLIGPIFWLIRGRR